MKTDIKEENSAIRWEVGMEKLLEPEWENLWLKLDEMYQKYHPQVPTTFEDEIGKYWGNTWKANTEIGRLRMVMLHNPGEEIKSIKPPYSKWRYFKKPDLDRMIEEHQRLAKAYHDEGVKVVFRKPEIYTDNRSPRLVKSIYTEDPSFPAVRGMVIGRMYDLLRRGEEFFTYQTLAEIGCPVIGMIHGTGMLEGGGINWLDEKHVLIMVHYPRANTAQPSVVKGNEEGARQYARILKEQDPEVNVRYGPGYGGGGFWLSPIDKHTSVTDPKFLDENFVKWLKVELSWNFIVPPRELSFMSVTGVVIRPGRILKAAGTSKGTKWLESQGFDVIEVDISSLVFPQNSGTIQCLTRPLIRDSEPKD